VETKKPDSYCEDANILPYGSNLGAPAIVLPDKERFINEQGNKASKYLTTKLDELKQDYEELVKLAEDTEMVYQSEYTFEPKVGHVYYLYRRENSTMFLSLIEPEKWNQTFIGAFKFSSDGTWEKED
jgi:hypothetical protein